MRKRRACIAILAASATLLAACGGNGGQSPSSTPTTTPTSTTTSTAPPATEKSVNPTAGNLFTPGVTAPAAPNVPPGQHPGIGDVP
jgi:ABC-type glycerol-3-phosphate transport system substrate-binding protein